MCDWKLEMAKAVFAYRLKSVTYNFHPIVLLFLKKWFGLVCVV